MGVGKKWVVLVKLEFRNFTSPDERNHLKDNLEESKPGRPYPALHIAGDLGLARRL